LIAGGGLGALLTPMAATSPLASGFRRSAVSWGARHSATPAAFGLRGARPYQAAPAPARTRAARPMSQVFLDFAAFYIARYVALFSPGLKSPMRKRLRLAGHDPVAARPVVFHTLPLASGNASRYGAATFRSLSMSSSLSLARPLLIAGLVALSLSACGRRGALEPPPSASAQAAATQQQPTAGESTLPSPVGTPRSTPRQGYTIPNKPFILDPLL
jgi:predicted small lipoprotein YifL